MIRSKIVLLTAVVLAAGAGVVGGRLSSGLPQTVVTPGPTTEPAPHRPATTRGGGNYGPPWATLHLTADQKVKMDAIWGDLHNQNEKAIAQNREYDKERDQAIQNLMTPEQQAAADKITADFKAKKAGVEKDFQAYVDTLNAKTVAILDDTQKQQFQAWNPRMFRDRSWPRGPATQRSTTLPAGVVGDGARP